MPFVKLKLNALTRLEFFDNQPSWKDLASRIAHLFHVPFDRVGVAYINENNEIIILTGEHHLQYFYQSLDQSSKESKFVVQDMQTLGSPTTIASIWSAVSNLSDLSNESDNEFTLFCWVLNESDSPFSVNIRKNKTVDDLKEKIKKKMDPVFAGIAYNTLNLWKLSPPIPSSKFDRRVQSPEDITGFERLLDPTDRLSEHFTSPPRKHVHIVVQPPIRLIPQLPPPCPRPPAASKKRSEPPLSIPLSSPSLSGISVSSLVNSEGSSAKRARLSGHVALVGIKEELSSLNSTIRDVAVDRKSHRLEMRFERLAPTPNTLNTPVNALNVREKAVELVQSEGCLHGRDDDIIAMIDLFRNDRESAETYLQLKRESLRRRWVQKELEKVGRSIPDFIPPVQ